MYQILKEIVNRLDSEEVIDLLHAENPLDGLCNIWGVSGKLYENLNDNIDSDVVMGLLEARFGEDQEDLESYLEINRELRVLQGEV